MLEGLWCWYYKVVYVVAHFGEAIYIIEKYVDIYPKSIVLVFNWEPGS